MFKAEYIPDVPGKYGVCKNILRITMSVQERCSYFCHGFWKSDLISGNKVLRLDLYSITRSITDSRALQIGDWQGACALKLPWQGSGLGPQLKLLGDPAWSTTIDTDASDNFASIV